MELIDKIRLAKSGAGSDLDWLVNDPNPLVRMAVASQGRDKDLDRLVSDSDWKVRANVACKKRDKDLAKLVSDPDWMVRSEVARQGRNKDLDVLVHDPDWHVRAHVAWQGRDQDLKILENDKNKFVREAASKEKMSEKEYQISGRTLPMHVSLHKGRKTILKIRWILLPSTATPKESSSMSESAILGVALTTAALNGIGFCRTWKTRKSPKSLSRIKTASLVLVLTGLKVSVKDTELRWRIGKRRNRN